MRVFINGQAFEVEGRPLTGAELKALSRSEGQQIFRQRGNQQIAIADDEAVDVEDGDRFIAVAPAAQAGSEHRRPTITIYVDGDPYVTDQHVLTGSQIKALAKKPPGNRLFRLPGDGQRIQIADDEKMHLHDREQFVTLPPVGKAS